MKKQLSKKQKADEREKIMKMKPKA